MRKILSSALISIMLLSLFTACGVKTSLNAGNNTQGTASSISTTVHSGQNSPGTTAARFKTTIYLSDTSTASKVVPEERELVSPSGNMEITEKAKLIIEELKKSGRSGIPQNSKVLAATLDKDSLSINFSKEFEKDHSGGSAGITITMASLVLSLTELNGVNSVSFLIEGKTLPEFLGHIEFNKPFKRAEYEYMIQK